MLENLHWGHIVANIIIVLIGFWFLHSCNKIQKAARGKESNEPDWNAYLYKLHRILEISEREIFKIAAEEKYNLSWEIHYATFLKTGELPSYLVSFLKEGKQAIDEAKVKFWI